MPSALPSKRDRWTSIRKRPRSDGTTAHNVLYWLDGRQCSLAFDDPAAAEVFSQTVKVHGPERALDMYGISLPKPAQRGGMTVVEWVRRYIDGLTGVGQKCVDDYNTHLHLDIEPFFGGTPLKALNADDMGRWVKHMETTPTKKTGRPLSVKSIANKYGFLSGALAVAVIQGHIAANPADNRRLPRGKGDADEIRALSRDEYDQLMAAITEHWRPFLEFLVASGFRWGEATALKPEDVDRVAGTVKVRRAWQYDSTGYHLGPPKTARSRRTVNIPKSVLDKLDYSREWLFTGRDGSNWRKPGTGPVRYVGFRRRVWDKAVAKAELDPAPTPHDTRHTCATWMLAAGVPITTVSRHLGHENITTTVNTYGGVDRTSFKDAADTMATLLS